MRSRPWIGLGLLVSCLLLSKTAFAQAPKLLPRDAAGELFPSLPPLPADPPAPAPVSAKATLPSVEPAPKPEVAPAPVTLTEPSAIPTPAEIGRATPEEAGRMFAAAEARLKALATTEAKDKAEFAAIREILEERKRWLLEWRTAAKEHHDVLHPEPSPERQATEACGEIEKCKALLDQAATDPDGPLPEVFRGATGKPPEDRLVAMKEAIDAARDDLKGRVAKLEPLRGEKNRTSSADAAALRARRDQLHQDFSTVTARRGDREEAVASATSPEARDLAAERLANFEWEARALAEKLDTQEARIDLAAKRVDLSGLLLQAGDARVRLSKKLLERMEWHYATLAEDQRKILEQAVALEQGRAAAADDPILRHRSRRNADLLKLESQVVSYEKALAATEGVSLQDQTEKADAAQVEFQELKKLVDDGNLSPLDALRLKNEYRRIGPERDRVTQNVLAASAAELGTYENALSEAEVDILNDSRDDRFEADSLLEKVGPARRAEALAMLDELEAKHSALLGRRRVVLQKLAVRAEATQTAIHRRIAILDEENAFIRTHIFWVRDAEPIGKATLIRAKGESVRVARALAGLAGQATDRKRWGEASASFPIAASLALILPLALWLVRRRIDRHRVLPSLGHAKRLILGLISAAIWPAHLALLAYATYASPWPHAVAVPVSVALLCGSIALFPIVLARMATSPGGWAEVVFQAPEKAIRQCRRAFVALPVAALLLLLPTLLAHQGWIVSGDRPVSAVAIGRLAVLAFELTCWVVACRLLRRSSPTLHWLTSDEAWAGWAGRQRRPLSVLALAVLALPIGLDAVGYRYTAQRLTIGWGGTAILALVCLGVYRLLLHAIDAHAWRWTRATPPASATTSTSGEAPAPADDPAKRFRSLARFAVAFLGMFAAAMLWNVDLALFRYLGEQKLWLVSADKAVTLGDFTRMVVILFVTGALWRHLNACFTLVVFPRLTDDPGIRYAVVTLCRYAILGVGVMSALSAVQFGMERIGVVIAALGVGLGFGLQEIVSNFVSGIILLLERPIRVGDVVSVNDMTGKVDRINIRATTIINFENQSLIVPNRQFITGNLVNWTHKDKIMRILVEVGVAYGTDPDKVTDILLSIAQEDPDILKNPVPVAIFDKFGDSSLNFKLFAHVPEPSLILRVKHRVQVQIQARFTAAGISIPYPTRDLRIHSFAEEGTNHTASRPHIRPSEPPQPAAPAPWVGRIPLPVPAESCYRGVDE